MKVMICGFFPYAQSLFINSNTYRKIYYVHFVHSNQSTVENLFSQLCAFNRDRPDLIAKGILAAITNQKWNEKSNKNNNKMYIGTDKLGKPDYCSYNIDTMMYQYIDEKRTNILDKLLTQKHKKRKNVLIHLYIFMELLRIKSFPKK